MSMPCRVCRSSRVTTVFDLGEQSFTGIFPSKFQDVPTGRLALALCEDCGLVQLADAYPLDILYGPTYGYRSGLNRSMIAHLADTVAPLERMTHLQGATVLDIGSNDGTLLRQYRTPRLTKIGIDPLAGKFGEFYDRTSLPVERFFTADTYWNVTSRPAKVVTSIAMLYDLPDPVAFARDVAEVLDDDGVWHMEVAYMPWMLHTGAFDTICHEHLEYYSLGILQRILTDTGFKIIRASTNATNGGSLAVTAAKVDSAHEADLTFTPWLIAHENRAGIARLDVWDDFARRVRSKADETLGLLSALRVRGLRVCGLGASTKGNVLLQYAGIGTMMLDAIGDVNPDKHGKFTPGTRIPIVPEQDVLDADYLLVLPWHFRTGLVAGLKDDYLSKGGRMIFPLPDIEVVGA